MAILVPRDGTDVYDQLVALGHKPPFRVDFGCGKLKTKGWVGMDIENVPGVDVIWDLRLGIPLRDDCVAQGVANQVLEHFTRQEAIALMDELHRVFVVGGKMRIMVPHYLGPYAHADPGHLSTYVEGFFHYFTPAHKNTMFNAERKRFWKVVSMNGRREKHFDLLLPVEIDVVLEKI